MTRTGRDRVVLNETDVRAACAREAAQWHVRGKRVLAVVPDHTRTAPVDIMFRVWHQVLLGEGAAMDVLIALGTHPPMSDDAINRRLGITDRDRHETYRATRFFNHRWADPAQLVSIGTITADEVSAISGGLLTDPVNVTINRLVLDYDLLLIIGPTFPHEVVGFSGGNKYLFPGISGPEIIDMFHWLAALITSPVIIGTKQTCVRAIVDKAASLVPVERKCASLVVDEGDLVGLYLGSPEAAWSAAADHSRDLHVVYEERPFQSVLSCAPAMYDELWVGGKCAYKLEPVVADGGELIIYAPHIARISQTHGEAIRLIGYHVRDYFVKQMARFSGTQRSVMAHSTHVKGVGTFEGGIERPRITVTLATQIPQEECTALNLGYRDHRTIDVDAWKHGNRDGRLYVPRAGETLYRLRRDPFRPQTTAMGAPQ